MTLVDAPAGMVTVTPSARVRLEVSARYGAVSPDVARAVQARVAETLATMCRVDVQTVDVSVEEVE